ncbi:hypothetical protein MKK84_27135 [Methylobacterium sp. E-065]|uniref:hypothetical protein n=1 Tax=Methylobacterium sp. E-065 TaxID=2836583 RepID=UPI001FB93ABB|nr:hypothetical protein [Methylobacterium sp. E-065]MCJ2021053.1 hypothetical protein [Methylobacterium sp. E-065]
MRQHYPLNLLGAEDAGAMPWTDGVPSTGVEGSYFGHALFTDTEAEVLAAIDGGGFLRNGADLTQLLQTISRGLWVGAFGGSATALTATLPNSLVLPSLVVGMRVRGIAASNYTGSGGTLAITGVGAAGATVSYPIVGADGVTALASGAWLAGQFLSFDIDASGNARFGGAASAGGIASAQSAGSGFNTKTFTSTTRALLNQSGANALATAIQGLSFTKKSATSLVRVNGSFIFRSASAPGNGFGPTYYLVSLGSAVAQQATSNAYPLVVALTPVNLTFGTQASPLPKGALSLMLQFGRNDGSAWSGSFLPSSADESGYPPSTLFQITVDEVEPQ